VNRLTNGRRALEPTSIEKGRPGERFLRDEEAVQLVDVGDRVDSSRYVVSIWMRRMGYHADPATCIHYRKTFTTRTKWVCSDCGTFL
jgi:hypothetical protein